MFERMFVDNTMNFGHNKTGSYDMINRLLPHQNFLPNDRTPVLSSAHSPDLALSEIFLFSAQKDRCS